MLLLYLPERGWLGWWSSLHGRASWLRMRKDSVHSSLSRSVEHEKVSTTSSPFMSCEEGESGGDERSDGEEREGGEKGRREGERGKERRKEVKGREGGERGRGKEVGREEGEIDWGGRR